ncbi:MAG: hypothetical protein IPO13_07090 [Rhodocyclaceae bacterium]|nr:hypothetical protein [Rhodocyclaceae bacterium]
MVAFVLATGAFVILAAPTLAGGDGQATAADPHLSSPSARLVMKSGAVVLYRVREIPAWRGLARRWPRQ